MRNNSRSSNMFPMGPSEGKTERMQRREKKKEKFPQIKEKQV